jgi:hypothetical protein
MAAVTTCTIFLERIPRRCSYHFFEIEDFGSGISGRSTCRKKSIAVPFLELLYHDIRKFVLFFLRL